MRFARLGVNNLTPDPSVGVLGVSNAPDHSPFRGDHLDLLSELSHFFLSVPSMFLVLKNIRASAGIEPAEPKFAVPTERHLFARLLAWSGDALGGSLAA